MLRFRGGGWKRDYGSRTADQRESGWIFHRNPTVGAPVLDPTKYGLGLAHIPTGSLAANQAYFMIAALAWNLKTWLLNLLDLGDGAVMRFQRFRYLWIWQAGVVAMSGRNTVVLKLPAGEYFQRFGVAMARWRLSR